MYPAIDIMVSWQLLNVNSQICTCKWQEGVEAGIVQAQSQHYNQSLTEWEVPWDEKP